MLFFAITPPRRATSAERAQEIADVTLRRLADLDLDGLVLYDIDDESDRTEQDRPFPFLPTMDPAHYRDRHLGAWTGPTIIYRTVGKYAEPELCGWLAEQDPARTSTVFVGAPSRDTTPATSLSRAYTLREQTSPALALGAVAIPERHTRRGDEHLRLLSKQAAGCSFFVTQVVYDVNAAKNLVSDYLHECRLREIAPVPIVFTFTVVGSTKTLEFLTWLGVDVPRWIRNEITYSDDPLTTSFEHARDTALELVSFCERRDMPFGVNVESVSNRLREVEAAVELARRLRHP